MDLLLDTHTLIFFFESNVELSSKAKKLIESPANQTYLSVASVWEMSIKTSMGKLILSKPLEDIISHVTSNGVLILPITVDHTLKSGNLPFHHKDPSDRLIIAQGICENMPIVSKDQVFDKYINKRIWK